MVSEITPRPDRPRQHPAPVVAAAVGMEAHEVPRKTGATPPANLGLHEPVLHFAVPGKCPRIIVARDVQRPPMPQTELHTQVQRRSRVVKQVGLHGPFRNGQGRRPRNARRSRRPQRQQPGIRKMQLRSKLHGNRQHWGICRRIYRCRGYFRYRDWNRPRSGPRVPGRRPVFLINIITAVQLFICQIRSGKPACQYDRGIPGRNAVLHNDRIGHDMAEGDLDIAPVQQLVQQARQVRRLHRP